MRGVRPLLVLARLAVVAVVAVLLIAGIQGASGEQAGKVVRSKLDGQNVRLTLPTGTEPPKGVVIWFHGQGANVNDRIDGPLLAAIRRDGWAVASSDFHNESWGNAASTADADNLVAWVKEQTGITPTLWASGSMGGATSINAMLHGETPPACWYGVKPALSLNQMQDVPAGPRFIAQAYGGRVPADRNPIANVDKLPLTTKYRLVASHEDEWVHYDQNAGKMIAELQARKIQVSELVATGVHQDPSHFNGADFVAFADTCLPGSDTPTTDVASE